MAKRQLSGIQATGTPHVGNYLGAIRAWVAAQAQDVDAFYMVADLHAITVPLAAETLRRNRVETMAGLIACGLDPSRVTLFFQSDVRTHCELAWLLGSRAYYGELQRMTQFKSKEGQLRQSISLDLFAYPVLQAADILIYQADQVPVGEDQIQHVELTRDIAIRCNEAYGPLFTVPTAVVPAIGARIMNLLAPQTKMSKSDATWAAGVVSLGDDDDTIKAKVMRAVTDSENRIAYRDEQPGVKNLLEIVCALADCTPQEAVALVEGKGYGALKGLVVDMLVETVAPIRQAMRELVACPADMHAAVAASTGRAEVVAQATLARAREAFGFD